MLAAAIAAAPLTVFAADLEVPHTAFDSLGLWQDDTPAGEGEVRTHLSPIRYTTLSSEMDGKIERLEVEENDSFEKGQLLVTFGCGIERARLEKAEVISRQALHTYKAYERLYALKSKSEIEVAQAVATAAAAAADVSVNLETVKRCTVFAPFSGRVFELRVRPFQYVSTGSPLLGIMDDSALELELIVPSKWLVWLKPGANFSVYIEEVERSFDAEVMSIAARIDPVSQSVKIKGRIVGAHRELLAGMGGRAKFQQ
jgi:RND family efflux transporter MFP subunit